MEENTITEQALLEKDELLVDVSPVLTITDCIQYSWSED